ncbi:hypothetical protein Tco_1276513 [Tanacetum coccineum]
MNLQLIGYTARYRGCITTSSTKKLVTPFEEPKRVLHSTRRLSKTTSLDYSSSLKFDLFFDPENHSEEEVTEGLTEPNIEEYIMNTQEDYRSDNEDANKHIKKVLEIVDLFHIPEVTQDQIMLRVFPMSLTGVASRWLRNAPADMQEVILFYKGLDVPTRQILDSKGAIPYMKADDANKAIQDMASMGAAIRNQGASIKALEIQIRQMSKVLQERGSGSLPGLTKTNPRDHVKSISTTIEADMPSIRRIDPIRYVVSSPQNRMQFFKPSQSIIPFPSRLIYDGNEENMVLIELMD